MRDPIDIPIEEKVALLLAANEAALKVPKIRFVNSGLQLLREEKTLATTDGTLVTQTYVRVGPSFSATAIADGDFQSYTEELAPRGSGWEYVESLNMPGNAESWASLAAEKLSAKSVEVGRYDLILDPTNLWLTIHESIGHPTELDRAMGYEANYAGTSFVAPPEKFIGKFRYGERFHEHPGRPNPGELALPHDVGRRRSAGRQMAHHQERNVQRLPDDARAGRMDSQPHRRKEVTRMLIRRFLVERAVPANAEHFAAARRQGHRSR